MCGLVGIAGNLQAKDEATMKRLFLLDYFRGPDSTGLAAVRTASREIKVAKLASDPIDLFDMGRFKEALNAFPSVAFIGHNRASTRGATNQMNAHPFHCGHIVGAHNGTLTRESHKELEKLVGESFEVDSQAIFAAIAKVGIEATVDLLEEGKEPTTGAWALVWYNQNENTLNFLRNKHRPLWISFTKEHDRIFWASEWRMIENAVGMSQQPYEMWYDKDGHRFFKLEDDLHYRFDLDELRKGSTEPIKPKVRQLKGKEPKPAASTSGYDPFQRGDGQSGSNSQTGQACGLSSTTTSTTSRGATSHSSTRRTPSNSNVTHRHLVGWTESPFAGYLSRTRFDEMAYGICAWCQEDVNYTDPGLLVYQRCGTVLCADCSGADKDATDVPKTRLYVPASVIEANA